MRLVVTAINSEQATVNMCEAPLSMEALTVYCRKTNCRLNAGNIPCLGIKIAKKGPSFHKFCEMHPAEDKASKTELGWEILPFVRRQRI